MLWRHNTVRSRSCPLSSWNCSIPLRWLPHVIIHGDSNSIVHSLQCHKREECIQLFISSKQRKTHKVLQSKEKKYYFLCLNLQKEFTGVLVFLNCMECQIFWSLCSVDFHIAIAYSNFTFSGAWTPNFHIENCQNLSKNEHTPEFFLKITSCIKLLYPPNLKLLIRIG